MHTHDLIDFVLCNFKTNEQGAGLQRMPLTQRGLEPQLEDADVRVELRDFKERLARLEACCYSAGGAEYNDRR